MKNTPSLTEMPVIKSLFTLAIPIMLANILQAAYQLTDSFWVGRLGEKAVAAVAMCGPIIFFSVSLGIGFSVAGSILVAQYYGAQNKRMVEYSAAQTLLMVVVVSAALGVLGWWLAPKILLLMNISSEVLPLAVNFIRWSFIGLLPNFSFFMFQSLMRGIGNVKLPMFIVLGTVILNFFLDPLFIFGYNFIPAFGVAGAAFATLLTQTIAAVIGLMILFKGKRGIHLHLADLKPDFKFIKKSFFLGLPVSIDQSIRSLGMILMTSIVAGFGTLAVAGYGAGGNMIQVAIIAGIGMCTATAVLVGQNIGAGQKEKAEEVARYSNIMSFGLLSGLGVLVVIFAPGLIRFFVPNDPAVVEAGVVFLRTVALFFGFIGIQMSMGGVFQASGNTAISMGLTITSQAIQIPLAFILSRYVFHDVSGAWYSFPVCNILIATIAFVIFKKGKWKEKKLTEEMKMQEKVTEEVESDEPMPYDY